MITRNRSIPFILLGILLFTNMSLAQQTSEITELKSRIAELEKRVAALEILMGTPSSNTIHYSEKWENRTFWRELKTGMSMRQVEAILGEPRKVDGGSTLTYWYYSEESWHSRVSFNHKGVHGWKEPE
jgi:hypothetical protein